jgi:hypothetical protein
MVQQSLLSLLLLLLLLQRSALALYQLRSTVTRQIDQGFCFGPTWRRTVTPDGGVVGVGGGGRRAFSFTRVLFAAVQHNGTAEQSAVRAEPAGSEPARVVARCTTGTSLSPVPSMAHPTFTALGALDTRAGSVDRPQAGCLVTEVGREWSVAASRMVVRASAVQEGDWQCRVCNVGGLSSNVTYDTHYVHDYASHAAAAARQPGPGGTPAEAEGGGLQNGGHGAGSVWLDALPPGRWLDLQLPGDASAAGPLGVAGSGRPSAWIAARVALDNRSGAGVELHAYRAAAGAGQIAELVPPGAPRAGASRAAGHVVARRGETLELPPGSLFSVYNGGTEAARLRVLTWTVPVSGAARAAGLGGLLTAALIVALALHA